MKNLTISVVSDSGNFYNVTFKKADDVFTSSCNCTAGEHGQICKHRLNILNGDLSGTRDIKRDDILAMLTWFKETRAEEALKQLNSAQNELEQAKKRLASAKKQLSRILNGKPKE